MEGRVQVNAWHVEQGEAFGLHGGGAMQSRLRSHHVKSRNCTPCRVLCIHDLGRLYGSGVPLLRVVCPVSIYISGGKGWIFLFSHAL
mgnify:CR=1 FL=1